MRRSLQAVLGAVMVAGLGVAAWCCGPKVAPPELFPTCPGDKFEVCEVDDLGAHNCVCPEE